MDQTVTVESKPMRTPQEIIAWVRSNGSDTDDLRDAAHEASHALEVRPRRWDRESIHAKIMWKSLTFKVMTELEARAVERLVCAAHGVEHDWEFFVSLALIEALKSGVQLPDSLGELIARLMMAPQVIARANTILRCGEDTTQER